jgi:hypothetical protein
MYEDDLENHGRENVFQDYIAETASEDEPQEENDQNESSE